MQLKTLTLAKQLLEIPSTTPNDANCQSILVHYLQNLGFSIEQFTYQGVSNLWARWGETQPLFVFAGHTDVVPPGPEEDWHFPPFSPTEHEGYLYARGAADMKGALAAMLTAVESFIADSKTACQGSIGFLITSAEEGPGELGTPKILERLAARNEQITWCLIGEPSSNQTLGDMLKIGRRGSLSANLTIHGKQGHVAYPHLADNPIHRGSQALAKLTQLTWDKGNAHFGPTSLQISNIEAGTGAGNVIPGELKVQFNLRYSPELSVETIQRRIENLFDEENLKYTLEWHHSGPPFYCPPAQLARACQEAIAEILGIAPELSTSGGTSDGRFIATTGCQVIELGLCNATIHKVNECVKLSDLNLLATIYHKVLTKLLG